MNVSNANATGRGDLLRQRIDEFLGLFFYGTLLKQARTGRLTDSPYGFGGRGEEVFAAQLDQELAERIGRASHNDLGEAIYRRLGGGVGGGSLRRPTHAISDLSNELLARPCQSPELRRTALDVRG